MSVDSKRRTLSLPLLRSSRAGGALSPPFLVFQRSCSRWCHHLPFFWKPKHKRHAQRSTSMSPLNWSNLFLSDGMIKSTVRIIVIVRVSVAALGEQRGHGPRPRALDNPEGAPRPRKHWKEIKGKHVNTSNKGPADDFGPRPRDP